MNLSAPQPEGATVNPLQESAQHHQANRPVQGALSHLHLTRTSSRLQQNTNATARRYRTPVEQLEVTSLTELIGATRRQHAEPLSVRLVNTTYKLIICCQNKYLCSCHFVLFFILFDWSIPNADYVRVTYVNLSSDRIQIFMFAYTWQVLLSHAELSYLSDR